MRIRAVAPFTALALSLAACGGGSSGGPSSVGSSSGNGNTGNTIAGLHANNHGTADVTGKTTVEIKANNYYFQPSILKGTPGQQITLHVVNVSGGEHNLSIDAQHVDKDIDGHQSVDAKVTMPASGTLAFWCAYHKSQGMVGGLLVSGSASGGSGSSPSPSDDSSGGGYGGYGNG
ncbi:MAG: Cupredoxin-like domain [Frankiaceae bacterium]|jgi:plastocyanin|nr:Cupredoxin-like domain [Frankiaceae bacterium]